MHTFIHFKDFLLLERDLLELIGEALDPEVRRNRKKMIEFFLKLDDYSYWNSEHSLEVAKLARDFGKFLGLDGNKLAISALTHDVGKTGVDKRVLHKPGMLEPEEREHMNTHAQASGDKLKKLTGVHGVYARLAALYHHTKPSELDMMEHDGVLSSEEVEFIKIVTIADIFEALTSEKRPYKKPTTKYDALDIMSHIDIVDQKVFAKFIQWQKQEFANEYRDEYVEKNRERLKQEYEERRVAYQKSYDHFIASSPRK